MIDVNLVFELNEDTTVETIGGTVSTTTVAGRDYTEGNDFQGERTPTYVIEGQTGGFTVRQSDVKEIIALNTLTA